MTENTDFYGIQEPKRVCQQPAIYEVESSRVVFGTERDDLSSAGAYAETSLPDHGSDGDLVLVQWRLDKPVLLQKARRILGAAMDVFE